MKINIWILNHYAGPPEITGGIRHYKFAENLIKKGYKVKIFAASSKHNLKGNIIGDNKRYLYKEFNRVPFVFIKARDYIGNGRQRILNMIDYSIGLLEISKKFDSEKPDIIISSSVHPLTWVVGYRLSKRYNAKFIAETRDLWPETLVAMGKIKKDSMIARILYKLEKFIYEKADKLIFTFPGAKDYVKSIGLDTFKVHYINNGVDLDEFKRNRRNFEYEDNDLDDNNKFKILYTGSMGTANELSYLIKAAEVIHSKKIHDIKFILFGDGYERVKLEEYVSKRGIDNVAFKGKVDKKYIPNILSKSNLNIFTGKNIDLYRYGLSLNKMFDYFASGKPTLSNIQCGFDMLDEYRCGLTVSGGSTEALVEGIFKFYNMEKEKYEKYSQNALKAAQDFDFKTLTEKFEKVI
ncbi:MAG: glycosyltransferase family 4 protein [Clostridia bacterium]|nr:glycosyltransferase family 4 protein [Clostridia bacterium]